MRFYTINDFGYVGGGALPNVDNVVAVGIASDSDVDTCLIGGVRLGPCALVKASPGVGAVRGYQAGALQGAPLAETGNRAPQSLSLLLYEKCDVLTPPGPRSAAVVSSAVAAGGPFTAATARLVLRLPFMGRKQAAFASRVENPVPGDSYSLVVRGVKYATQLVMQSAASSARTTAPYLEEMAARAYVGLPAASTVDTGVPSFQGDVFYVGGGGDLQESFDELQLFVYGTWNSTLLVTAEASGERG